MVYKALKSLSGIRKPDGVRVKLTSLRGVVTAVLYAHLTVQLVSDNMPSQGLSSKKPWSQLNAV